MKNIFFCSSMQSDMFPQNTRSKFDSYIDVNDLEYISDNDIEAAIKINHISSDKKPGYKNPE